MAGDTRFRAEVLTTERLTPHMMRVTLEGQGLAGFATSGRSDEWMGLRFDPDAADEEAATRTYTVRRWDPVAGRLVIDFVIHADGIGTRWAEQAEPGDPVEVSSPHGAYDPPNDAQWQFLVTDATGLPAMGRILEEMDEGVRVTACAEIPEPADAQELTTRADLDITWLPGSGLGYRPSRLEAVVRAFRWPEGRGYIWMAGEAVVARSIRKHLRHELRLPPEAYSVVGYWRERREEWTARFEAADLDLPGRYRAALAAGKDDEEIRDEMDALLERSGL